MIAAALLLAGSVVGLTWTFAGASGVLYVAMYAGATLPGLPVGFAVFGRQHAAGWIVGMLIGYGMTQLTLWAVIAAGGASWAPFTAAWLVVTATLFTTLRGPRVAGWRIPFDWTRADTRALLLVLLLVPALMGPPYVNLGRSDAAGTRYYRAYFTADFLWHCALASELGKFSLPPRNPYMASRPMNYYWTYFLLPATVARLAPERLPALQDVQRVLKINALLSAVLMMGVLFLLVRSATKSAAAAAIAVLLGVVAASAEGTYAIIDLLSRGRPLAQLRDLNIDAMTAWSFRGLRIDNIPRSLWYTPQHTVSLALGLGGLLIAALGGAAAPLAAIAAAGAALGLATTINPLLGAACSAIYGICIIVDALRRPGTSRLLLRHFVAAVPVVMAVAWSAAGQVIEGAGEALHVGFAGFARNAPLLTLLLSVGPVLIPALPGLRALAAAPRAIVVAMAGIAVGLFLLYFVRISDASWVGFRAGQILLVMIPILLARTFDAMSTRSRGLLCAAVLIVGLPTTVIDTFNAQDIGNHRQSPGGFKWTISVSAGQEEAFRWIRRETPLGAIVQMEPILRGREHWTLIPSFASRRMAAGLPISLLPSPEYLERSNRVRSIFAAADAQEAASLARRLGIDYLYVDGDDRAAYPTGMAKFVEHTELFVPVFQNAEAGIYQVR